VVRLRAWPAVKISSLWGRSLDGLTQLSVECRTRAAQEVTMAFKPPAASRRQVAGIPFDTAVDFAPDAKKRFDQFDRKGNNRDPSKCKALLAFPGNGSEIRAVFWSSKMGIDTDGPAAGRGRKTGAQLDPSGQNVTSFRFANGKSVP